MSNVLDKEDKILFEKIRLEFSELYNTYSELMYLAAEGKTDSDEYISLLEKVFEHRELIDDYDRQLEIVLAQDDLIEFDGVKLESIMSWVERKCDAEGDISVLPLEHLLRNNREKFPDFAMYVHYLKLWYEKNVNDLKTADFYILEKDRIEGFIRESFDVEVKNDDEIMTIRAELEKALKNYDDIKLHADSSEVCFWYSMLVSRRTLLQLAKNRQENCCSEEVLLYAFYLTCFFDQGLEEDVLIDGLEKMNENMADIELTLDEDPITVGAGGLAYGMAMAMMNIIINCFDSDDRLQLQLAYAGLSSCLSLVSDDDMNLVINEYSSLASLPISNSHIRNSTALVNHGCKDALVLRKQYNKPVKRTDVE